MDSADAPGSRILDLMREHRRELLDEWLAKQLEADTLRLDLIAEGTLHQESEEFLATLADALAAGELDDLDAAGWRPVTELLEQLSVSRDELGFSPTETATFVLSLKQPLIERLQRSASAEQVIDEIWTVNRILDHLALHTTEIYQRRREATIARQQAEMIELSTPVVKLWDGILALPLIGTLDTGRSQMVTETLLQSIAATGSQVAIIDLTGVPAVDTEMAQHLMRTVAAVRLMGAECILSGIRPQIAQTIVHLQIDLGDIKTEADLASALEVALRRVGLDLPRRGA